MLRRQCVKVELAEFYQSINLYLMSQFLNYTLNIRLSKNITRGHMAQRREHHSAIGMADNFHSVTIKPNLSPQPYF